MSITSSPEDEFVAMLLQDQQTSAMTLATSATSLEDVQTQLNTVIQTGLTTLQELKDRAVSSGDPDLVESFAKVMSATAQTVGELNKMQLEILKAKLRAQLDFNKHQHKLEQIEKKNRIPEPKSGNKEGTVVMSREDLLDLLGKPKKQPPTIDVD